VGKMLNLGRVPFLKLVSVTCVCITLCDCSMCVLRRVNVKAPLMSHIQLCCDDDSYRNNWKKTARLSAQ